MNFHRVLSRATAAAAAASPDLSKEDEEMDGGRGTQDEVMYSKVVPTSSVGVASENGGSTHIVQVSVKWFFQYQLHLLVRLFNVCMLSITLFSLSCFVESSHFLCNFCSISTNIGFH